MRIIRLLTCFIIIGFCAIAHSSPTKVSPPNSLDGYSLAVTITDTIFYDHSFDFAATGHENIYFSDTQVFYDATAFNDWHFIVNYTTERNPDNSILIRTALPENRANSDLLTFRQILTFTSNLAGNTVIEFYKKDKLAFKHQGTFSISKKSFEINTGGFTDRSFQFDVNTSTNPTEPFNISPHDTIKLHFIDEHKIEFTNKNVKYSGINQSLEQKSISTVHLHGTLDKLNTTYDIDLNYFDYNKGIFNLSVHESNAQLTGQFETHRYTDISFQALKGEMIKGNHIQSKHTGISYPYEIYLPSDYTTTKKNYPVLYITDGQWALDLANVIESQNKKVILVFIDQGPEGRREIDYKIPGANAYAQFFKQELVPLIETKYRTNKIRSFFGTSLGGLLGGVLISQETSNKPFFKNYILADGSFWGLTPEIIAAEEKNFSDNRQLPINILLSGTLRGNGFVVADYESRFRNRLYRDIKIVNVTLPYLHEEMAGPTLTQFINYIEQ